MSGNNENSERLFKIAYDSGKQFLSALEAGKISYKFAQSNIPIGVGMMLGGPTHDFMIGRIFESATDGAFDRVIKENEYGVILDRLDWITDSELEKSRAKFLYLKSNCDAF